MCTKNISINKGIFELFFPFFGHNVSYLCSMINQINTQIFYKILTKFYDSVKKPLKFWHYQILCYWVQNQPPHHIKQTPLY